MWANSLFLLLCMLLLDRYYSLYFRMRIHRVFNSHWMNKKVSNFFHKRIQKHLRKELDSRNPQLYKGAIAQNTVVSVTSFGSRVITSALSIHSILRQRVVAEKTILWLDQKTWNRKNLPTSLRYLCLHGLEIRFVLDLGPYTKFYYAFESFPGFRVITVDDDIVYPRDHLENLLKKANQFPAKILCSSARMIPSKNTRGYSYINWPLVWENRDVEDANLLALGVMGIVYPPEFVETIDLIETLNAIEVYPTTDDLWLKKLSLKHDFPIVKVSNWGRPFVSSIVSSEEGLMYKNLYGGINDKNWKKLQSTS